MRARTVEQQLRVFLLALSGFVCAGTIVELWFAEHMESTVQFVPFILSVLGMGAVLGAFYAPRRKMLILLRVVMGGLILGSLFGVYEHVTHNMAFEQEIQPNATAWEAFWKALSGASPFLAPGILILAAVLALGATYRHPALGASKA